MNTNFRIRHEFVETMPPQREEGVLYVSIPFATAVHSCFCGCGTKVVTPIKPAGWELTYDGDTVSLWPSVGSWGLHCRSHYIIRKDTVVWAGDMTQERIDQGRAHDRKMRDRYYETKALEPTTPGAGNPARPVVEQVPVKSFGDGVKSLLKADFGVRPAQGAKIVGHCSTLAARRNRSASSNEASELRHLPHPVLRHASG